MNDDTKRKLEEAHDALTLIFNVSPTVGGALQAREIADKLLVKHGMLEPGEDK